MINRQKLRWAYRFLRYLTGKQPMRIISILKQAGRRGLRCAEIEKELGERQALMSYNLNRMFNYGILGKERLGHEVRYYLKPKYDEIIYAVMDFNEYEELIYERELNMV